MSEDVHTFYLTFVSGSLCCPINQSTKNGKYSCWGCAHTLGGFFAVPQQNLRISHKSNLFHITPLIVVNKRAKEPLHLLVNAIKRKMIYANRADHIYHCTAFSLYPRKSASFNVCFNCLKKSSICQRALYRSQIDEEVRLKLLVMNSIRTIFDTEYQIICAFSKFPICI